MEVKSFRVCSVCGFQAITKEDLELFVKDKSKNYGRQNICKKCFNEKRRERYVPRPKIKLSYLKKCIDCGLEAQNKDDLKLFKKNKKPFHGRLNLCKKCSVSRKMKEYRKIQDELIKHWGTPLLCYFCDKEIIETWGTKQKSLVGHSLDGNHDNWNPENKVPAHHKCHSSYHGKKSGPHRGWKQTPEAIEKIRQASTGRKHTLETRLKITLGQLGEKHWKWKGKNVTRKLKLERIRNHKKIDAKINKFRKILSEEGIINE